jgi:hypothetical protein
MPGFGHCPYPLAGAERRISPYQPSQKAQLLSVTDYGRRMAGTPPSGPIGTGFKWPHPEDAVISTAE